MGTILARDVEKALSQIKTVKRKSYHFVKECKICGEKFETLNDNNDTCLRCQIVTDLKLPSDTLVNGNFVKLWKTGRYHGKGVEDILREICEGVILLPCVKNGRSKHCGYLYKKQNVTNESVEQYVTSLKESLSGKMDALVILKYRKDEHFSVYAFRYGKSVWKEVKDKSNLFHKRLIMSLVSKNIAKEIKEKFDKSMRSGTVLV